MIYVAMRGSLVACAFVQPGNCRMMPSIPVLANVVEFLVRLAGVPKIDWSKYFESFSAFPRPSVCSQHGSTPLHKAAGAGKTACIALLLEAGARNDMKDDVRIVGTLFRMVNGVPYDSRLLGLEHYHIYSIATLRVSIDRFG